MVPKNSAYKFRCFLLFLVYVIGSLFLIICAIYVLLWGGVGRILALDQPCVAILYRLTEPDAMKSVVGAMGLVGLALSYINAARTHRVKGLLMNDVIRYYYPYYGCVFISYGVFALLGRYCWGVGARTSGVICLLGLFFGLLYQIIMAWKVFFSDAQSEKLATNYIKAMVYYYKEESTDVPPMQEIRSVARYISRRFVEENRRFVNASDSNNNGKSVEKADQDIMLLIEFLDEKRDVVAENESRETHRCGVVGDFNHLFYLNSDSEKSGEAISLHDKIAALLYGLPSFQSATKRFSLQVRMIADTWQSILTEAREPNLQIHIACEILRVSAEKLPSVLTPLCCGLILCLHELYIRSADISDGRQWNYCADFMHQMTLLIGKTPLWEKDNKIISVLRIMARDMVAIFLCLNYLDQASTNKKVPDRPFRIILIEMQGAQKGSDVATRWDNQVIRIYLCYAYLIQSLLPMASPENLSYADRDRINTLIVDAIVNWFNSDVWEEGWNDADRT